MIESPLLTELSPIKHGFFTRRGGVSEGLYASLNCGQGSQDALQAVAENRRRVAATLGATALVTAYQVHGADVVTVTKPWQRGDAPKADAMVTATPGIALGILTADCAPILLADAEAGVIGAAHAGWKSAFSGIAGAVVGAMEKLGADRARIRAAIGPSLALSSFEVGAEFRTQFLDKDPANARFFVERPAWPKPHFDLSGFVAGELDAAGICRIDRILHDTYEGEQDFFSYRRACHKGEADYGRQVSAILIAF